MSEYLSLGQMEEVDKNSVDVKNEHFYIPHHHVIKESSLTTRLRVVFNASAKSSSGVSLNDTLMIGPKNQDDLFAILLRFRNHSIAVTSDLLKVYRQVNIENEDRKLFGEITRHHLLKLIVCVLLLMELLLPLIWPHVF
ncbi:hypothetical protein AVEN_2788-1 [Araneus ventricosus]|uniref:Uncharacterized protein n=1 Tax=Araneus ventricosus TaxID=182803 RepID=A0A4Y2MHX5_ARAVE|nr:hypothetical protein AVEN_2788-1 [Araneus ventricosus]